MAKESASSELLNNMDNIPKSFLKIIQLKKKNFTLKMEILCQIKKYKMGKSKGNGHGILRLEK